MATVNFLYRSTKTTSNLNLRLLFRHIDKDYVFGVKTKLEVSKHYWSKEHKLKRVKDIDLINRQAEVNKELYKLENHILKAFNNTNAEYINKEWLIAQIKSYYNPNEQKNLPKELIKYIDTYIESKRNELSITSIRKINVTKHKLERFQDFRKKVILIKDVNLFFKKEFEDYCLKEQYAPNTITREVRFIKTICYHAKYNGLETSYQLDKIKSKYTKVKSIYLNEDEIQIIENKKGLSNSLDNAKDWLLISCYTGQRVSDFLRFNKSMIRFEKNNEGVSKPLIEFTQKKTGKIMTIPLSQKVMDILNKRNAEFPHPISDQKYNQYIKEVCKLVGIKKKVKGSKKLEIEPDSKKYRKQSGTYEKWELVTSHIGRRSFATNYYGKIPTSFLIYVTGHSTEAMFLDYIGKSNKDIAMELTNYF